MDLRAWACVIGLGLGLGCTESSAGGGLARAPSPDRPAWAGVVADHWLPGPAARGDRHALDTNESDTRDRSDLDSRCRACHVDIAREWTDSQHAGSWSSAAFTAAFAIEPLPFCQACHAPEVEPTVEVPAWAAELGVGCVTCHVEPGTEQVWSATSGRDPSAAEHTAPHPVAREPAFAGPQACARCHEFGFPDAAVRERPLLMQSTIREHAASAYADRSCADCHMPMVASEGRGHRSHAFAGAYDREMLARSLVITATRTRDRVRLTLAPGEVGHAVPTGDLLRRLEVRVDELGSDGTPHAIARRWLGRRFGPTPQHNGLTVRGELEDTRVGPKGAVVEFTIPASVGANQVRWSVTHQRVAHAVHDPARAPVEGELEIAAGVLPLPESEPSDQ